MFSAFPPIPDIARQSRLTFHRLRPDLYPAGGQQRPGVSGGHDEGALSIRIALRAIRLILDLGKSNES
jgi:hypothetical protein